MNKKTLTIIFIGIIAVIGSILVFKNKPQPVVIEVGPKIHFVSLLVGGASPDELAVKVGESIQFNSMDGKSHNISQGEGNDYDKEHEHNAQNFSDSGTFGPDEGFLVSFNKIGTYFFHDHLNPDLFVTVVVYDPSRE